MAYRGTRLTNDIVTISGDKTAWEFATQRYGRRLFMSEVTAIVNDDIVDYIVYDLTGLQYEEGRGIYKTAGDGSVIRDHIYRSSIANQPIESRGGQQDSSTIFLMEGLGKSEENFRYAHHKHHHRHEECWATSLVTKLHNSDAAVFSGELSKCVVGAGTRTMTLPEVSSLSALGVAARVGFLYWTGTGTLQIDPFDSGYPIQGVNQSVTMANIGDYVELQYIDASGWWIRCWAGTQYLLAP